MAAQAKTAKPVHSMWVRCRTVCGTVAWAGQWVRLVSHNWLGFFTCSPNTASNVHIQTNYSLYSAANVNKLLQNITQIAYIQAVHRFVKFELLTNIPKLCVETRQQTFTPIKCWLLTQLRTKGVNTPCNCYCNGCNSKVDLPWSDNGCVQKRLNWRGAKWSSHVTRARWLPCLHQCSHLCYKDLTLVSHTEWVSECVGFNVPLDT